MKKENKLIAIENRVGIATMNVALGEIMEHGMDTYRNLTDEEIKDACKFDEKTSSMINPEWWQFVLETAREIAQNNTWKDIFPFIRTELNLGDCPIEETTIYRNDMKDGYFDEFLYHLKLDNDDYKDEHGKDIDYVTVKAIIEEVG